MSDSELTAIAKSQFAFLVDTRYCNNCKTCEIACKMERRLPIDYRWRKVRRFEGEDSDNNPVAINVTMSCNHCENPQCLEVCPEKAYRKMPNGIVMQYNSKCIGCMQCVDACPYSAPALNAATWRVGKCDMCYDRLNAGMQPYCVHCCPNGALEMDTFEKLAAAHGLRQDIAEFDGGTVIPAADAAIGPSIIIKI